MVKEKRSELIGVMVFPSTKAEVQRIAGDEERSLSKVAGVLLERGLDLYRKDGILKSKAKDNKLNVVPGKTEEAPRKKNRQ